MGALAYIVSLAIDTYVWIIILQIIIHWLVAFDVLKVKSPQAQNLMDLMQRATDPVYKPLRKYIPPLGGIDITPIIVIVGLNVLKAFLVGILI